MNLNRQKKSDTVQYLNGELKDAGSVIIVHYAGLTVENITDLRGRIRKVGASFKVAKNSLAKLALSGTQYEGLADLLTGQAGIAYSEDPIAAAKAVVEFAKSNEKLVLLGGAIGQQMVNAQGIESLAKLPSLDELRAKLVGLISAPATRIAGVLQAPGGQVARVLSAYSQKG